MMKRAADRFLLLCSVNVTDWPGHVNIDIYFLSDENWKEASHFRHTALPTSSLKLLFVAGTQSEESSFTGRVSLKKSKLKLV